MEGMFGDLFKMLGQQGPDAWFVNATQLALNVARGADGDPNPDPIERQRLEGLAPLVGRHVDALFGVAGQYDVEAVTRTSLTTAALHQWKPLLAPLATMAPVLDQTALGENPLMAQLANTLGPLFLGFQLGSVAGHFAERAWSLSALPLPQSGGALLIVVNNVATFADEWTLSTDVVCTFALAREAVARVILTQAGTGDALRALLFDAVQASHQAQADIMGKLQGMMNPENMAGFMGNPEALLEGIAMPEESDVTRAINAAGSALAAFFDEAAFSITETLHGPQGAVREAWRRHRLSDARGEDAAAALFSMSLQGPHHEAGLTFVKELAGRYGLGVFDAFLRVDGLPSADELTAPQAWYERVTNSPLA